MDRIYMNRIDGEQRIHIEIASNEVSDLLDDLANDPEHFDATRRLLEILRTAEEIFCPTVSETRRTRDAARQAAGQPDTEAAASPVCECQPVRLHDDYREAAVYLHEATCPTVGQPAAPAETPLDPAAAKARARLAAFLGYEPDEHDALFESHLDVYRAAILNSAADALDADMERFFAEWPDEPRNSPYANGRKDAANDLRRLAAEATP